MSDRDWSTWAGRYYWPDSRKPDEWINRGCTNPDCPELAKPEEERRACHCPWETQPESEGETLVNRKTHGGPSENEMRHGL